MLAYDHRSEEGINLIRQYVEDYAGAHDGVYPLPADVAATAPSASSPATLLAQQPLGPLVMAQRRDAGSFEYAIAPDRLRTRCACTAPSRATTCSPAPP